MCYDQQNWDGRVSFILMTQENEFGGSLVIFYAFPGKLNWYLTWANLHFMSGIWKQPQESRAGPAFKVFITAWAFASSASSSATSQVGVPSDGVESQE